MVVTFNPSMRGLTEAAGASADGADASGVETFTDAAGNTWDSLGNLVETGSAVGPDGDGGTTAIADDTQHHLSLSEQYAVAQRDGFAVSPSGANADQKATLELLRTT